MSFNYYKILGVTESASGEQIKKAYKQLAKKYHPDKNQGNSFSEEYFKKINEAYRVLSDPRKKEIYDFKIRYPVNHAQPSNYQKYKPPQNKTYRRKPAPAPVKINYKKVGLIVSSFLAFIVAILSFYRFMNNYSSESYYKAGLQFENAHKYYEAYEKYSEAIMLNKHNQEAYYKRAMINLYYANNYQEAIYDLTHAVELADNVVPQYHYYRGKAYVKEKKYDDALEDFLKSYDNDFRADSSALYRAEIYNYLYEDRAMAIKEYDKALAINDELFEASFGKGIAQQAISLYKESLDTFDALEESKKVMYYKGFSYLALKDSASACKAWEHAFELGFEEAENLINAVCKGKKE